MFTIMYGFKKQLQTSVAANGNSVLRTALTIVLSGVSRKTPLKKSLNTTKPHQLHSSLEVPIT